MVLKKSKPLPNVLVVCHGNICRSPLAVAVLTKHLGEKRVRGRALGSKEGQRAAKKIRDYVAGTDLENMIDAHRSVRVSQQDVDWANVIVYMDGGNLTRLKEFVGAEAKAVCLAWYSGGRCSKIADPNYMKRGPELDSLLSLIVESAGKIGAQLTGPRDIS